jgi:hypothetical protein
MRNEILTRCGYRCDLCLAYKDNIQKEDRRQLLSDGWFQYFGFRINPEDIWCDGCLNDGCLTAKLIDGGCPVRPCVKEKSLENCSQCDDYICDKLKGRLVDGEEMKARFRSIPRNDYKLFISPYDNKKRLAEMKEKYKDCTRMLNKLIVPTLEDMARFISGDASKKWEEVIHFIKENYNTQENFLCGGEKYGWAVQYKQNKSTTLFTLCPERRSFTMLLVFGTKELESLEQNAAHLSKEIFEYIKKIHQYHDGKWIWLKVNENTDLKDIYTLMEIKKKPKK